MKRGSAAAEQRVADGVQVNQSNVYLLKQQLGTLIPTASIRLGSVAKSTRGQLMGCFKGMLLFSCTVVCVRVCVCDE